MSNWLDRLMLHPPLMLKLSEAIRQELIKAGLPADSKVDLQRAEFYLTGVNAGERVKITLDATPTTINRISNHDKQF
jgi:hypothetical protein